MAPSRRKGGKAAAAAAACRQWKVGDLVLAKVKGFPAWPATVSKPEKWGYPADWKKILVYFFGTQQIAFCNPADVEAFTEDKKQSLLVKRQGKGADFVRAVQEIIDSYEKLKRQNQLDEFNSSEEVAPADGGNSSESLAQFEAKDLAETSEPTVTGRNEPRLPTGEAPTGGLDTFLDEKETLADQCNDGVSVTGKPVLATYTSRKRSGGSRPRKRVTQKKTLSAERPENSALVDSSRCQNFLLSSDSGNKTSGDASSNLTRSASLRRNKRFRKSPNVSHWEDVDSSTFIPNGSVEDDGSEIATLEPDSFSLNEGSGIDSGCKLEHSDAFVECLDDDVPLSKGLDFQINAVVIKKKRKLNRKCSNNEAVEPAARQEAVVDLELRVHNSSQDSQTACENLSERYSREDGDEHLPLVKRARVRMRKSSLKEDHSMSSQAGGKRSNKVAGILMEEDNSSCQAEEINSDEAVAVILEQMASSGNRSHGFSADRDSAIVNVALDIVSSPKNCAEILENQLQLSRVMENQSVCCSADGEAALPPSKRLHRALEAMSANVAEERNEISETLLAKAANSDVSSSDMDDKSKGSHSSQDNCLPSNSNAVSVFSCSSNAALVQQTSCFQSIESPKRKEHEKTLWVNSGHEDDDKDSSGACFEGSAISSEVAKAPSPVDSTPTPARCMAAEQCEPASSYRLVLKNECSSENIGVSLSRAENPDEELDILEHGGKSLEHNMLDQVEPQVASQNGIEVVSFGTDNAGKSPEHNSAVRETTESRRTQIDKTNQANDKNEVVEEIKHDLRHDEAMSVSSSEDLVGCEDTLSLRSSPVEPGALTCPPTVCHVSTAESSNGNQSCSSSSPKDLLCQKRTLNDDEKPEFVAPQRPKSTGKGSNSSEVHASLSSFEGMLGLLTRTKESIGRATRMAIDCAKLGVSAKVVEILVRTLENESSLHRRVDLFFLVDSITRCSRGLKGDVGCVYPPAIQAVLPRLLASAAPPGNFAMDNRRQCMKVLRLWLDRRVIPESIVRHHMRELDMLNASSTSGPYARRSARTERALDDPIRDMEGMQVDEYGSNSSFQLPGFCMPRMLKDEDECSDSDGESFEAITPEHYPEFTEREIVSAPGKHTRILEEVDGELEMEDVAPPCGVEMNSTSCANGVTGPQGSHEQFEERSVDHFAPPPLPPSSPPLPSSPPPPPPPPPPLAAGPHSCSIQDNLRQPLAQQSAAPRIDPSLPNAAHYPQCRDHLQMQHCDSYNSFGNYSVHPTDNAQYNNGSSFHQKSYPPGPPHPPSSHFSYVPSGQHVKSQRETPPYSHRFHSSRDVDGGNFYSNRERMRQGPYDSNDGWRYPPPQFHGPRYHDKPKAPFEHVPYGGGPLREPGRHHHDWGYPPRGMHNRNFRPF